jgi:hypothetical protein
MNRLLEIGCKNRHVMKTHRGSPWFFESVNNRIRNARARQTLVVGYLPHAQIQAWFTRSRLVSHAIAARRATIKTWQRDYLAEARITMKKPLLTVLTISACLAAAPAIASGGRHGHWHGGHFGHRHFDNDFGFYFGDPFFWGGPRYYSNDFLFAPPVIIQREPPVYIQQPPTQAQAAPPTWYYCPKPAGYYPYVPNCSQQWVPVDPRSVPPAPNSVR